MGIPSFYRWLVERYPRSVAEVVEEAPLMENDRPVPVDVSLPNPNGYEFDNLYLDMNGIIHPCFHPEGLPPPSDYDEVFQAVFMYIDRVFSIVRPRQLLYLAIDGVAPRAKMNQQRSRRFRAAKEMEDEASLKPERHESGENEMPVTGQSKKLDSNIITPGTEFMELLSSALRYYINLRMNEEAGWKGIKVILSDASVPGEGEHKIMSYIRLQRNLPGFNPNTRHCLYGLDADLIMLALATHEIHFSVLREEVRKDKLSKTGSFFTNSGVSQHSPAFLDYLGHYVSNIKFQFLNVWILREYLMYDLRIRRSTSEADPERLIDDFVFMCLLVGNDFLPHIPSLSISEGAIDLLMMLYKREFVRMGGYLTDSFKINLARVEHFIQAVGSYESVIFRKRIQMKKASGWGSNFGSQRTLDIKHLDWLDGDCNMSGAQDKGDRVAAERSVSGLGIDSAAEVEKVKLGEDGWKGRYYVHNFQLNSESECEGIQRQVVTKYIEGLSWVMHYYYEGVCSWQWFYPFYYAPFASDFHGFANLEIKFTLGKPFKPYDQLMGVLPAASAHALPLSYGKLMKDDLSPIADFYPANFEVDMTGKRFSWQGICKLPFIDEARLLSEIAKVEHTLTDEEKRRNSLGSDLLFVYKSSPLAVVIVSFSDKSSQVKLLDEKAELEIDPKTSGGMNGYICIDQNPVWPMEICSPIDCWPAIANFGVITVFYKYPPSHPHIPNLPEGVILPDKSVSKKDIIPPQLTMYDGASFRMCSRKLMPNSISGPNLSRLAHQLVLLHISAKAKGHKRTSFSSLSKAVDTPDPALTNVECRRRKLMETYTKTSSESQKDGKTASSGMSMVREMIAVDTPDSVRMNAKYRKRKLMETSTKTWSESPKGGKTASPGTSLVREMNGVDTQDRVLMNAECRKRKPMETSTETCSESQKDGKTASPEMIMVRETIHIIGKGGEITTITKIGSKKKKKYKNKKLNVAAGSGLEKSVGHIASEQRVEADCNIVEEFPILKDQKVCSGIQDRAMDSSTTNSIFYNASELVVAHNDCALGVRPMEIDRVEPVKKKLDSCNSIQKLENVLEGQNVQCGDIDAAADKVVEVEAEPRSKKKKKRSKKKRRVEEVKNEASTEISEISAMKGVRGAACDPVVEESGDVSCVGKLNICENIPPVLEEKHSADVDISESCSSDFTLNKSGAGIVEVKPRESNAAGVMEAVADMKPTNKKRRRSKKKRGSDANRVIEAVAEMKPTYKPIVAIKMEAAIAAAD